MLTSIKNGLNSSLILIWLLLIVMTIINTTFAETANPNKFVIELVCITIMCKGVLVADHFMGLKSAPKAIRTVMISYIIILPTIIGLAVMFPEVIEKITTI